jgi:hypothetical protein
LNIRKRSAIMVLLVALSSVLYGAARHYAPHLVLYVVEQTLAQKAPSGIQPAQLRERLHALLAATPDPGAKMARLLQISERLEKVQSLTSGELDSLLANGNGSMRDTPLSP